MKLKAVPSLPSMKLAGRVPGDLHADMITYAEYYREVLGEPIDLWPLVVQMLRTFMHSDRAFRAWRRQHRSVAAAGQVVSHAPSRVLRGPGIVASAGSVSPRVLSDVRTGCRRRAASEHIACRDPGPRPRVNPLPSSSRELYSTGTGIPTQDAW